MKPFGGLTICVVGCFRGSEATQQMLLSGVLDLRTPKVLLLIDALETGFVVLRDFSVSHVFCMAAEAQIASTVVELVAVLVVNKHTIRSTGNDTVHQLHFSIAVTDGIPTASDLPIETGDGFHVIDINLNERIAS
nr:hypothetical protein [Ralstonia pickettii]